MTILLQDWIPEPLHEEIDTIEVSVPPARAYELCRHLDLASSPLIKMLFSLRTLPERLRGQNQEPLHLAVDDLAAPSGAGFHILSDRPGEGFVVGAIGKVWEAEIPYLDIAPEDFAAFDQPGWARVAWSMRFVPAACGTRIELALRFDTTDSTAMLNLERYYHLIGPFSHFIRRHLLSLVARELGPADPDENHLFLPGDEFLTGAKVQVTHGITIAAEPAQVWPWLVQLGCHRAGWYSYDQLDNGGEPSATAILPEFQQLAPGDQLAITPIGDAHYTVLQVEPARCLVLGACFDLEAEKTVSFDGPLPASYLRDTWAFTLEAVSPGETRLRVRLRADYAPARVGMRSLWMLPLHNLMESRQLLNLKRRAEGLYESGEQAQPAIV